MNFLTVKNRIAFRVRRMLSPAWRSSSIASDSDAAGNDAVFHRQDSPFVLVAQNAREKWDVYENDFENPLASFNERQDACDYANDLAKTRKDSMVLIRGNEGPGAGQEPPAAQRTLPSFFIRTRRS